MRIAVVSWTRRGVGGVEQYLGEIVPALMMAGHDVAFWCEVDRPIDRSAIPLPIGVPVTCAETRGVVPALADLRAWNADVLYMHGLSDPDIEAEVLGIAPAVLFLHGYHGTCISGTKTFKKPVAIPCTRRFGWPCLVHYFPHGCGGRSPVTMLQQYRRQDHRLQLLRRYAAVVTHSAHMATEFERHGISPRRVGFITRQPLANTRGTSGDCWRLLFAGRMDRLKGGHVLLDALPQVKGRVDRDVRLMFAGDGPERANLQRQAADIERAEAGIQVAFSGWVEPTQLDALMANADLLVVPSLWPEPFGSVGLSACHLGLPAAAFAVGGIPDWLTDGVNGCLAPGNPPTVGGLAQAILRCLVHPRGVSRFEQGAREMGARFTVRAHLNALSDVFEGVVRDRRASACGRLGGGAPCQPSEEPRRVGAGPHDH